MWGPDNRWHRRAGQERTLGQVDLRANAAEHSTVVVCLGETEIGSPLREAKEKAIDQPEEPRVLFGGGGDGSREEVSITGRMA
ncbi:Hypothetical predicted protein [Marmota monax]|uniref:Uncharacterized protein n=1 Tax=Marmota monax TaxID=9995 RepID=A0A5E4BIF0_MARMO|nr:hypothetical protein GHT09_001207 [Marmota monax]VTJ69348.1 Hypothetical predicted protein [Marmota monax]